MKCLFLLQRTGQPIASPREKNLDGMKTHRRKPRPKTKKKRGPLTANGKEKHGSTRDALSCTHFSFEKGKKRAGVDASRGTTRQMRGGGGGAPPPPAPPRVRSRKTT